MFTLITFVRLIELYHLTVESPAQTRRSIMMSLQRTLTAILAALILVNLGLRVWVTGYKPTPAHITATTSPTPAPAPMSRNQLATLNHKLIEEIGNTTPRADAQQDYDAKANMHEAIEEDGSVQQVVSDSADPAAPTTTSDYVHVTYANLPQLAGITVEHPMSGGLALEMSQPSVVAGNCRLSDGTKITITAEGEVIATRNGHRLWLTDTMNPVTTARVSGDKIHIKFSDGNTRAYDNSGQEAG